MHKNTKTSHLEAHESLRGSQQKFSLKMNWKFIIEIEKN